jgi:hypothetical protein
MSEWHDGLAPGMGLANEVLRLIFEGVDQQRCQLRSTGMEERKPRRVLRGFLPLS